MPIITPNQTDGAELLSSPAPTQPDDSPFVEAQSSYESSPAAAPGPAPYPQQAAPVHPPGPLARKPWWRRRKLVGGVAALVAVGAVAAVGASLIGGDDGAESDDASGGAEQIRAVEATTGDLAEFVTVDGTLAYGDPVVYTAPVDGTVTRIVEVDDVLDRGDVAYAIDESPVVVFWGDTPLYRPLETGVDDGADVEVLEANLLALGYGADGELVVDEVFDAATTTAIEAFQEAVGLTVDGTIDPSSVLLLSGPALVSEVAAPVGSAIRATNPVLSLQLTDDVTTVGMPVDDGLITDLPTIGEQFSTGDVAFEHDTEPVIVVIGDVAFERTLSIDVEDGDDIELLEQTLADLGFDADGALEVDDHFDEATEQALADWQDTLGLSEEDPEDEDLTDEELGDSGVLEPADYVVLPADHVVIDVVAERGDRLDTGEVVFTVGVSTRTLVATIDEADADLIAVGDRVEVDFADTTIGGTIVDIDDPVASPTDPEAETVEFEIALDDPAPDSSSSSVDLEVQVVERIATDVTLVPAGTLVSLGDGTYAVEEVRGNTTVFVAVVPGEFSDGMVEVEGIEPGTLVVDPS